MIGSFMIYALPRSRTAWLAEFFCTEISYCYHDGTSLPGGAQALARQMVARREPFVGSCDSGAIFFRDLLRKDFPSMKEVVVLRDPGRCIESARRFGIPEPDNAILRCTDELTSFVDKNREVLTIDFEDLDKGGVQAIWHHCIPDFSFPTERYERLRNYNIQITQARLREEMKRGTH